MGRSFEERVFARFVPLMARLQTLEGEADAGARTKPIWNAHWLKLWSAEQDLSEFRGECLMTPLRDISRKIAVLAKI